MENMTEEEKAEQEKKFKEILARHNREKQQ